MGSYKAQMERNQAAGKCPECEGQCELTEAGSYCPDCDRTYTKTCSKCGTPHNEDMDVCKKCYSGSVKKND